MIRALTADDHDAFRALRQRGLESDPAAFSMTADLWRRSEPAASLALLKGSVDSPDRVIVGAFEEERLVGLVGFRRESRASLRHKGSIWGLIVDEASRRRGHGRALLSAACSFARSAGVRYVRAVLTTTHPAAPALFASVGFEAYGTEKDSLFADAQFHDHVYMARRFHAGGDEKLSPGPSSPA